MSDDEIFDEIFPYLKGVKPGRLTATEVIMKERKEIKKVQLVNCEIPVGVPIIVKKVAPQRWGYEIIKPFDPKEEYGS